jgi:hypothetical protein
MTWRHRLGSLALLVVAGLLAACGGGSNSSNQPGTVTATPRLAQFGGAFAFSANGTDPADGDYFVAGSLTADGNGKVTGIEDLNLGSGIDSSVPFTGTYTIDSSSNVMVTLSDGPATPTIFTFPLPSGSTSVKVSYNGTGTGTLQAQTSGFTNSGTYAFTLSGEGTGTVTASGTFTLGGAGVIASGSEQFQDGTFTRNTSSLTGIVSPTFTGGRGTAAIGANLFSYYAVSPNQIILAGLDDSTLLFGTATKQ